MDEPRKMENKRVLVTGSGTGIGREVALEFARCGAVVAIHYAHSDAGAKSAVEQIIQAGGRAEAFKADLRSIEETRSLAMRAAEFLGGLDILVNNAGVTMNLPFEQVTPEQFDTLYHVNIRAQFFLTQALVPVMLKNERAGVVVNMTSIHAFEGYQEHSVYAGTKGAIVAYTRELAVELAPKGIRVNAIAPGWVHVESQIKESGMVDLKELGKVLPCGFVGMPLDVAKIAVFLASDDARYIVGQTLIADGGTTAWMPFSDGFRKPLATRFGKGYVPGI